MILKNNRERHIRRKLRIRNRVQGSASRPRLTVSRSLKHIYAQLIDDESGKTLVAASSLSKDVKSQTSDASKPIELSKLVGKLLAQKALEKNITVAIFDRNGFLYHGRVSAVAEGAREGGLKF